ncbi:hypothetical protein [Nocardioides bruguierae]|uniref:hypothetical protein n=1 Tax=Nocardioides bruguierae TaxID=2945102 RepID=UPI002020F947|nr:hypothetical protein [Nocardioides bruguierae]MCL8026330.1 hypothetical protein [Nocardioides bruguierae]
MSDTETPDPLVTTTLRRLVAMDVRLILAELELDIPGLHVAIGAKVAQTLRAAGWVQRDERSYLGRHVLERTGMRTRMDDPTEREEQDRG